MKDWQIEAYQNDVLNAKTDEDFKRVSDKWSPVIIKCFRIQSLRIKEINEKMDELKDDVLKATTEISARITELHKKPTFKDSKIEWIMANIEKILLTLIVLALVFGREWVTHLFGG